MNRESWTQPNRLLDEALDLAPNDLDHWLAHLGPKDEPLKARVRALLDYRSSVHASSFLEAIPSLSFPSVSSAGSFDAGPLPSIPDADCDGAIVGAYRLLRPRVAVNYPAVATGGLPQAR
jgi:hypothetical protein